MSITWRHPAQAANIPGQELALIAVTLAATAAAILAGHVLVSIAVTLALVVASIWKPPATLVSIPAVIGFGFQTVDFNGPEFSPSELLILATTCGVAIRASWLLLRTKGGIVQRLATRLWTESRSGFAPVAVALLVVGVISLLTVADPAYRRESLREFRWVILEPVLFFLLLRWYLTDRAYVRLAALLFASGAAVVALVSLFDLIAGTGLSVEGVTRISGTYPHPNALGLFLERAVVFTAVLALAFRRDMAYGWLAITGVTGLALLLSFSRGAIAAAGVVAIASLALGQRRRVAIAGVASGIVLASLLVVTATDRVVSLFDGGSGSLRVSLWLSSLAMAQDHPMFGVGLDQFLYQYAPRYVKPEAWPERFTSHPHNILLDVWLRLGIMGVVVALAYVATFVWKTREAVRRHTVLGLAAGAAIVVGMLHGLVDNGYFLPDLAITFWLMTAILEYETRSGDSMSEA